MRICSPLSRRRDKALRFPRWAGWLFGLVFAAASLLAADGRVVTIGTGSGMIDYPQAQETLKLQPGDTLVIAAGTYAGLALGHLSGTAAAPITVRCDPQTLFTRPGGGDHAFANISHLRFENFQIRQGGTWVITGASHDLLFKNFTVTQARGWSFRPYDRTKVFDGTKASAFYNFKWEDCTFGGDGAPMHGDAISSSDWEPVSNMKSVALDFEVSHCTFQNYDFGGGAGSVISVARAFNLQVHDCGFSNIGFSKMVIGHDVVIGGAGYFKIYNNTFTRQWANCVRLFPAKLRALGYDGPDAVTRYYNNISWEKRKYPDFEQNSVRADDLAKSPFLARAGAEVYFNTQYRSRRGAQTGDPYVGVLVDVYAPDVVIKYNLVIEPECDLPFDPARNYVYALGAGRQPGLVAEGNLVFRTWTEAGLTDPVSFRPSRASPARDAAPGRIDFITQDHYGHARYVGTAADVGAVERQADDPEAPPNRPPVGVPPLAGQPGAETASAETTRPTNLSAPAPSPVSPSAPAGPSGPPAWAADSGRDPYGTWADLAVNGVTQRLRWIPPGTFLMGSPRDEAERDPDESQHPVTLTDGFWLGETEMTQAFFQAVTRAEPKRVPGEGQLPVRVVSWDESQKFLARLNELKPGLGAVLPTEAQWEYACRAGTTGPVYAPLEASAWHALNTLDRYQNCLVHPVRQKQPNAWGLYDMLGNVWELCRDFYGEYPAGAATDPAGPPAGHMRVERGGSFNSAAGSCRAAWRWGSESKAARGNLGLRLAVPP